jgi:hypothetical protein
VPRLRAAAQRRRGSGRRGERRTGRDGLGLGAAAKRQPVDPVVRPAGEVEHAGVHGRRRAPVLVHAARRAPPAPKDVRARGRVDDGRAAALGGPPLEVVCLARRRVGQHVEEGRVLHGAHRGGGGGGGTSRWRRAGTTQRAWLTFCTSASVEIGDVQVP